MKFWQPLRKYASLIIVIGFAIWAAWYARQHAESLAILGNLSIWWVILLLGLAILKLTTMGLFTKVIMASLEISLDFPEWFGLSAMTSMGNYLSPFRGGAAIRGVYLKTKHNLPYTLFLSTLSSLYVLSFSTNAVIGLLAMTALWLGLGITNPILTFSLAACLLLPVALFVVVRWTPRLPGRWAEGLNRVIEGWGFIAARPGAMIKLIALSILNASVTLLMIHFSFAALGTNLPLVKSLIISTLFLVSAMIPITPAGLGVAEMILVLTSQTLGMTDTLSILSAGLNRSAMLASSLLLGPLFGYLLSKRTEAKTSSEEKGGELGIAIIGTTLSGNKGAAAMLLSGVENISKLVHNPQFKVFSIYPQEDRQVNRDERIKIVSAKPLALLMAVPLAFLWWMLAQLDLSPGLLRRNRILETLDRSSLLIDMSGISFSDGRGIVLAYNTACILPALLLGKPVMKYSQALGPFESFLNRLLAKILLPRLEVIAARGEITQAYLQELGLSNVRLCADAAFALDDTKNPIEFQQLVQTLNRSKERKVVGIAASSVVRAYCRRMDIDYCQVLADFANRIMAARNYDVWLIAHAMRRTRKGGRTSDVDTCQTIYDLIKDKSHCRLLSKDYSPTVLRAIIENCDYFIASRFHAMVSALVKGVPMLVTAWSHKYREVLLMFGLENWVLSHRHLTATSLLERFEALLKDENEIRAQMAQYLPHVVHSSRQNAQLAASLLNTLGRTQD
ncbi:MAG: hypothetical protein B6I34_07030 [Anaerolineaceae bacterium 4572_32.1]|nr:MAG: hypothetical protein B6I34_07030 [Anaerolineaceae bacterium 4572_32.1]